MEERDRDLKWEEAFRISTDRKEHRKEIEEEENKDRGKFHALRWKVHMKDK